ncbi:hypothetical protein G9A89_019915 [Geosiphon pyriformis]|nr:hypothetical protein G9A89_019915 [Geosiphon pyriformis]
MHPADLQTAITNARDFEAAELKANHAQAETLLRRTYDLMETLENKWQRAADNIQKSQEKQKERHNNKLPNKPVEFKIRDKVLLHYTKVKKQWSRKFDPK